MRPVHVLPALLLAATVLVAPAASAAPASAGAAPAPARPTSPATAAPAAADAAPTWTVTGTVVDGAGVPVPDAPVAGARYPDVTTRTASNGKFRLVVSTAEYELCVDGSRAGGSAFGYDRPCLQLPATSAGGTTRLTFRLTIQGLVTGRVVDAQGAPLHDVALQVANTATGVVTGPDGTYSVRGLPAGDTAVCGVGAGDHGGGSVTGYLDACTQVTVRTGAAVTAPDLVLDHPGAAVTGTVRDGRHGAGLAGVRVWATRAQGSDVLVETTTRSDGSYALLGIVDQLLTVCFDGSAAAGGKATAGYGDQCWKYSDQPQGFGTSPSTPVAVQVGTTTSGIDGALPRWGAVAGTVTLPGGAPAAGATVTVSGPGAGGTATTGVDGSYRIASLPPGNFSLCVHPADPAPGRTGWLDHCIGGSTGFGGGPATTVVTSNATTRVDDTVPAAGRLTGVVRDSAGRPVAGAHVSVAHSNGNSVASETTDASGRWTLDYGTWGDNGTTSGERVVPGDYTLFVGGPAGSDFVVMGHPSMFFVDGRGFGGAMTPVHVVGGETAGVIDVLRHAAVLQGTVTDAAGGGLMAALTLGRGGSVVPDPGNSLYVATSQTGTWTRPGLPPGTYHLCVTSFQATAAAPASFLDRCPAGASADGVATTVTLAEGATQSVDTALAPAAGVSGTVTTDAGHPLRWSSVEVRRGGRTVATTSASSTGAFSFEKLPPGRYTVCASGGLDPDGDGSPTEAWAWRCWGGAVGGPGAPVTATAGSVRTGVGIALPPGVVIGGVVQDASGAGIAGADIVVTSGGQQFLGTSSGSNGAFDVEVPAGTYTVCATAKGHASACHEAPGASAASPVTVAIGQPFFDAWIALPQH